MAEIIKINKDTWRFEDDFVRFFLLEGKDRAALIDSGANCPNALEMAKELTDKPIFLLNTHGDGDHTSGTAAFSEIYIHPADYVKCGVKESFPETKVVELFDGEIIDLGDRPLKIVHIPGHTEGSVAILDENYRVLIAGDSVQKGHIFMFGAKREPEMYEASLEKLIAMKSEFDSIYASHDEWSLPADYVEKVKDIWQRVKRGEISYEIIDVHDTKVKSYTTDICGFYMDCN
ncbi:MAG: MBL fold metallo-hydrolase [Lachnospiraceae bacterium]|nr:MBL fold metallo-hydrolase [Lachnospiraceae bacterium]